MSRAQWETNEKSEHEKLLELFSHISERVLIWTSGRYYYNLYDSVCAMGGSRVCELWMDFYSLQPGIRILLLNRPLPCKLAQQTSTTVYNYSAHRFLHLV